MIKPAKIPNTSGVYFFRDKNGGVLYLGKALNLKNRVGSYFNSRPKDQRITKMLELAATVDWQKTDSETEALILESQLIKKHQPPFNIMLRDDKQYFYVGFNNDDFPKLIITHQPFCGLQTNQTDFIGPFTDGNAPKTTLRLLRRIFPYCTCKQKHNNYCLNYHIGKCLGFCCLKKEKIVGYDSRIKEYKKNIKTMKGILSGKKTLVIKQFEKEMKTAGKNQRFEKATELRDKIEKLKKVFENAQILNLKFNSLIDELDYNSQISKQLAKILKIKKAISRIEGYDVANIQGEFAVGAMVVFHDGQLDKKEYKKFKIKTVKGANDTAMLKEILIRRFNHTEWPTPDLIIIDGGKGQLNVAISNTQLSTSKENSEIPIIALTKNEKHVGEKIIFKKGVEYKEIELKKLPIAVRNLILQVDSEAHRFAIGYYRKLHRAKLRK